MKVRLLLVASMLVLSNASTRAERVLTGDFVEVGRTHAGVSRSQASVELVNATECVLDVRLGRGTTRLASGETLLMRTPGGNMELVVSCSTLPGPALKATLRVEPAVHHSLTLAYEELMPGPRLTPSLAPADETSSPGTQPVAKPARALHARVPQQALQGQVASSAKGSTGKAQSGPSWKKRKRSGRVDIGRKRKKTAR